MTAVATNDDSMRDFQARVSERIRSTIGDLMPESVIQKTIDKTIRDLFFAPGAAIPNPNRKNSWDTSQPATIPGPSWFEEAVRTQATPIIVAATTAAVESHREWITSEVVRMVDANRLTLAAAEAVRDAMTIAMRDAVAQLMMDLRSGNLR